MSTWVPITGPEVRVGVIGLGVMGRNHVRVLGEIDGARLTGISDPVRSALRTVADSTGATTFDRPEELIASGCVDAVIIASPTTTHRDLVLSAIDNRLAILVEKPVAATPAEADEIVAAAAATGIPVQVGHIERFNPAVLELGRLLDSGWLSTVYAITSRRGGPMPERIRDVGVTIDLATHDVDILSWIAAERPWSVFAEMAYRVRQDHEDLLFGLMRFPSGTVAMLDVDWLTPAKRRSLSVLGEEGMFELDYLTQRLTFTRGADTSAPELIGGYAPTFHGESVEIPVSTGEPLAAELTSFIETARTGSRPQVDATDGRWAVIVADALLRSAAAGQAIEIGDAGR